MKHRRGMNARTRVCPYCGDAYDRKSVLLREDGVSVTYVHAEIVCVSPDEPELQEVYTSGSAFYECDE